MLRMATRASAGAGIAALVGLGALLLAPPIPETLAWVAAYVLVGLLMASAAGFAWIALTLPPGAPTRTSVLRWGTVAALGLVVLVSRGLA